MNKSVKLLLISVLLLGFSNIGFASQKSAKQLIAYEAAELQIKNLFGDNKKKQDECLKKLQVLPLYEKNGSFYVDESDLDAMTLSLLDLREPKKSGQPTSSSSASSSSSIPAISSLSSKEKKNDIEQKTTSELATTSDVGCYAMPTETPKTIYNLKVTLQKGEECGQWAALNAYAIQALIDKNQSITAIAINQLTKEKNEKEGVIKTNNQQIQNANFDSLSDQDIWNLITQAQATDEQVQSLIKNLKLKNTYIVSWYASKNNLVPLFSTEKESLSDALKSFKSDQKKSLSLVCVANEHWTTITLVKGITLANKTIATPVVLYANSADSSSI